MMHHHGANIKSLLGDNPVLWHAGLLAIPTSHAWGHLFPGNIFKSVVKPQGNSA